MRSEHHTGIGQRLRALRKDRGLTLGNLSKRTGYSVSALSKMERERLGLSYDKLARLAVAFEVEISALFNDPPAQVEVGQPQTTGRRSIGHRGGGKTVSTPNYEYRYISPELSKKQMVPIVAKVRARSLEEFGSLVRHGGEEWIYVLKGEIEVHTEFYSPERLREGDSVYLDSRMGHAYINKGRAPAELVCVCSAPEAELLENVSSRGKVAAAQQPFAARPGRLRARTAVGGSRIRRV